MEARATCAWVLLGIVVFTNIDVARAGDPPPSTNIAAARSAYERERKADREWNAPDPKHEAKTTAVRVAAWRAAAADFVGAFDKVPLGSWKLPGDMELVGRGPTLRGTFASESGDHVRAASAYETLIVKVPNASDAREARCYGLPRQLIAIGDGAEAIRRFGEVVKGAPDSEKSQLLLQLGDIQGVAGEFAAARVSFEASRKAFEAQPSRPIDDRAARAAAAADKLIQRSILDGQLRVRSYVGTRMADVAGNTWAGAPAPKFSTLAGRVAVVRVGGLGSLLDWWALRDLEAYRARIDASAVAVFALTTLDACKDGGAGTPAGSDAERKYTNIPAGPDDTEGTPFELTSAGFHGYLESVRTRLQLGYSIGSVEDPSLRGVLDSGASGIFIVDAAGVVSYGGDDMLEIGPLVELVRARAPASRDAPPPK